MDSGSRSTDGPSERLVVTNLHYEVMPSDLKVCISVAMLAFTQGTESHVIGDL